MATEHKVLKTKLKLRSYYVCNEKLLSNLVTTYEKDRKRTFTKYFSWKEETLCIFHSDNVQISAIIRNPAMAEIRIAHIHICLYALLELETSFSFFEPSDLSFSNEGSTVIF